MTAVCSMQNKENDDGLNPFFLATQNLLIFIAIDHFLAYSITMAGLSLQNKKIITGIAFILPAISFLLFSCGAEKEKQEKPKRSQPIVGTWQLLRGTVIEKGDTTITDYTGSISFIKIINDTHFAFLQHDEKKRKGYRCCFCCRRRHIYSFR